MRRIGVTAEAAPAGLKWLSSTPSAACGLLLRGGKGVTICHSRPFSISLSFKTCTRQFKCRAGFNTGSAEKKRVAKWDLYLYSVLTLQELKCYWQSPGLMAQVGPGRIQDMFKKVTAWSSTVPDRPALLVCNPGIWLKNIFSKRNSTEAEIM